MRYEVRVLNANAGEVRLCEECRKAWLPADNGRWQAYWIDNGPEDRLVFYCPNCAELEFGG